MKTIDRIGSSVEGAQQNRTIFQIIRKYKIHFLLVFLFAFIEVGYQRNVNVSYDSNQRIADNHYTDYVKATVEENRNNIPDKKPETWNLIKKVFILNDNKPLWTNGFTWNENAKYLLTLLLNSRVYGIDPQVFHIEIIDHLTTEMQTEVKLDQKTAVRFKVESILTDYAFKFLSYLSKGVVFTDTVNFGGSNPFIENLPVFLFNSIHSDNFELQLLNVQPDFYEYVKLQQALEKYVNEVPLTNNSYYIPDPKLDSANCYLKTKDILAELGYYYEDSTQSEKDCLLFSIKKFQKFHGLTADGKIGRGTIKALCINSMDRYNKIALTLEKMRQMGSLSGDGLFVNIPSFKLRIFEHNTVIDEYRVIVGNPKTPTPELSSMVQTIITNPDWNVPQSISSTEILNKVKNDSTYLKAHNFVVYDAKGNEVNPQNVDWKNMTTEQFNYYLRQDGDGGSALGKVKFLFPNGYSVYLHDTPSRGLFSDDYRALSHGCVRVQNPEKLADYLLKRDNQMIEGSASVKELTDNKIARTFFLGSAIPIQICYFTCEADDSCNIYFYNDIYERDVQMLSNVAMQ